MKLRTKFKLKKGESHMMYKPITDGEIHITGTGKQTYIWIGGGKESPCYGTLTGKKTLKHLATNILKAINK